MIKDSLVSMQALIGNEGGIQVSGRIYGILGRRVTQPGRNLIWSAIRKEEPDIPAECPDWQILVKKARYDLLKYSRGQM